VPVATPGTGISSSRSWPRSVTTQAVVVTDDRAGAAALAARVDIDIDIADARTTPFLCVGTRAEIAAHLLACRERWGFSYFTVRDAGVFAPVIRLLRHG
jgi:hypothetical protein